MGTVIQNSTLRALILEAFSNDKSLMQDIFETIFKENPHFLEELTPISNSTLISESFVVSKTEKEALLEKTEINDTEIRILAKQQFAKYGAVFKALA